MKLHYLQHEPEEDLGKIAHWAAERGIEVTGTLLFKQERLPELQEFDWLVIMGGNMNVEQETEFPWLTGEKELIRQAIAHDKLVLGICLGAQLVAHVLGAQVKKNLYPEIGWFPIKLTPAANQSPVFAQLPQTFMAFEWHGDTFDLPAGSQRMAESAGCANQAFTYQDRVVGLQFHPEFTLNNIQQLIKDCGHELVPGSYIQPADTMLAGTEYLEQQSKVLWTLLDDMLGR